jgi:hypothetical protein
MAAFRQLSSSTALFLILDPFEYGVFLSFFLLANDVYLTSANFVLK